MPVANGLHSSPKDILQRKQKRMKVTERLLRHRTSTHVTVMVMSEKPLTTYLYIYIYHVRQNCLHKARTQMTVMVPYESRPTTYIYILYMYIYHLGQKSPDNAKAARPNANSAIEAPMAVVTKKSSPPPASPHRHKGKGSEAAQGPRKQHGSGSAPSACDPLQGDDGRSDDMHAASLGLSRSDQNDQTCSTLEAIYQSDSDTLSGRAIAMLSGSTALSMLSV